MTEIKPVAWTSKKGLRHLATMGFLSVGKHEDRERKIPLYGPEAADEITRLRQILSEAQRREMEARAKALEEAAMVADTEEELPGEPSKLVVAAMEAVGHVGNARAAVRTTKASIAKRIRALQSEER